MMGLSFFSVLQKFSITALSQQLAVRCPAHAEPRSGWPKVYRGFAARVLVSLVPCGTLNRHVFGIE